MSESPSMIDTPDGRESIKARYEAGERATLCAELNIGMKTLSEWALRYGWTSGAAAGLTRQEQAGILIEEGYSNATIARRLSMSQDTVRSIRHKLTTNRIPRLPVRAGDEPVARERPIGHWGGWYCGACAWWGDTIDDYLIHKKQHERQGI